MTKSSEKYSCYWQCRLIIWLVNAMACLEVRDLGWRSWALFWLCTETLEGGHEVILDDIDCLVNHPCNGDVDSGITIF